MHDRAGVFQGSATANHQSRDEAGLAAGILELQATGHFGLRPPTAVFR